MDSLEIKPEYAAIVDGVCLMMMVDGELASVELEFMHGMFCAMLEVDIDVAHALLENSLERLADGDVDKYVDSVVERLQDNPRARDYLMVALQICAMSDGIGTEHEYALLDVLSDRFGLSDEDVAALQEQARAWYEKLTATAEA